MAGDAVADNAVAGDKSPAQQFADLFKLTPAEAVRYLQRRGHVTQTFDWRDLWQDEHARQFTVSRLARLDLLQALQAGITESVQGELSRRDWMRNARGLLAKEGWWGERTVLDPATGDAVTTIFDNARLKLIFDMNTRMAHSAGLWERIERNKASHPYVRYITKGDERVRAAHRQWNGLTLPVDHPHWQILWPPNGWRCRCRVMSMTTREYARRRAAGSITTAAPKLPTREWVNKRTGEIMQVPVGIDPGFDYNVGVAGARAAGMERLAQQKLKQAPADLARAAEAAGLFETTRPTTVEDFIAAGRAAVEGLPDLAADPEAWHAELYRRLAEAGRMGRGVTVASKGEAAKLVAEASRLFPAAWNAAADAAGPLHTKTLRPGQRAFAITLTQNYPAVRLPAFGVVRDARAGTGFIAVRTGDLATAVHEYAHRLQAVMPELDELFQTLHRRRVAGDPVKRIRDVGPAYRHYGADEFTREDHYVDAYQGREYRVSKGEAAAGGALEVITMAMEYVVGGMARRPGSPQAQSRAALQKVFQHDKELLELVIGVLFHWSPRTPAP